MLVIKRPEAPLGIHFSVQEEMQKLQAEVAQLDLKLAAVNEVLVEATEARENERYVALHT